MEWLRAMRMFASVVQHGSLSAAGRQLGLSPASISRHISALEEELHGRLINRSSRKLTLTEAGRIYFQEVSQILRRVNEANESVAQLHANPRGTLRVHSRMLVGHLYIVPALPRFLAAYPDLHIDLQMSNFPIDLVEHDIDVDIRIGKLADSALVARKLVGSERIVCAAPAYLQQRPDIARPEDLARHNCLTYRLNLGRAVWHFRSRGGARMDVPIAGSLQSDNGLALLTSVRAGLGIGLMPDWAIRDDLASGRLRRLFTEWRVSHAEFDNGVYAVYQKSRHVSGKLRVFVDFLVALFRQPAASRDC